MGVSMDVNITLLGQIVLAIIVIAAIWYALRLRDE